jgi:hypothetical protein
VDYLEPKFKAGDNDASRYLCTATTLGGNDQQALYYCDYALTTQYQLVALCVEQRQKGARDSYCPGAQELYQFGELKSFLALAQWRAGKTEEAADSIAMALEAASGQPGWPMKMINIAINTPDGQKLEKVERIRQSAVIGITPQFDFARSRIFAAQIAAEEAAARRRFYVIAAAICSVVFLGVAGAYRYRANIASFLRRTETSQQPVYRRYPNRSYRIAAFFWVAFWIMLAAPFLALASWVLKDFKTFSWEGLQDGFANTGTILSTIFENWAWIWFYLLPVLLLGFIVFKLYGRYSLPKPQRHPIQPLYAATRVFFFALSLVTMYYSLERISHTTDQIVETGIIRLPEDTMEGNKHARQTILAAVASSIARQDFNAAIDASLDNDDIAHAEIYVDIADWQSISIAPEIRARYDAANSAWQSAQRHAADCAAGGLLRNAETLTQIICMIGVDLTAPAYADWADIGRQMIANPMMGTDTDPLIVALATLGILLRQFDSTDDTEVLRYGSSFIKVSVLGGRAAKASPKLTGQFRHLVTDAFDYDGAFRAYAQSKMAGFFGVTTRINPGLDHGIGHFRPPQTISARANKKRNPISTILSISCEFLYF